MIVLADLIFAPPYCPRTLSAHFRAPSLRSRMTPKGSGVRADKIGVRKPIIQGFFAYFLSLKESRYAQTLYF